MTTAEAAVPTAVAGWYTNPDNEVEHRYWNGERWTDAIRSAAPAPPVVVTPVSAPATPVPDVPAVKRGMGGLAVAGYITAALMPIVGLILGIIVGARHREGKNHAPWIILVSVAAFIVWFLLLVGSADTTTTTTTY